jgi:hypothetical protein
MRESLSLIVAWFLVFESVAASETAKVMDITLAANTEGGSNISIDDWDISAEKKNPLIDIYGFIDARFGVRTGGGIAGDKDISLGEVRLQLETKQYVNQFTFNFATDFLFDPVTDQYAIDLASGGGAIDPRRINVEFSPASFIDMKIGRQILTWGAGDFIFINDLFAKDWDSFFLGRDVEYLKAPVDAAKISFFFDVLNIDVVYTPKFGADRFVDGRRASFFDRTTNAFRGRDDPLLFDRPNGWFEDDEIAARAYRSIGAFETALYYYNGFWKSPAGQSALDGRATFPKLSVYGGSLRGPLAGGIAWVEAGYYDSVADAASDPLIRNSELRFLVGFEKEIATELTASIQYNLERKLNYGDYLGALPSGALQDDRNKHLVTLRLTKLLLQQNLELSAFTFYSPSDKDGYLRFNALYKISDDLRVEGGGNFFYGPQDHTFFAQFQNNNNIYVAIRRSF